MSCKCIEELRGDISVCLESISLRTSHPETVFFGPHVSHVPSQIRVWDWTAGPAPDSRPSHPRPSSRPSRSSRRPLRRGLCRPLPRRVRGHGPNGAWTGTASHSRSPDAPQTPQTPTPSASKNAWLGRSPYFGGSGTWCKANRKWVKLYFRQTKVYAC